MVVSGFACVWLLLCGSNNFSAFGAISVEVTIKKMSNKNTMSVIDDMLNSALTLFRFFNAMVLKLSYGFVQKIHEVGGGAFHFCNDTVNLCN